MRAVLSKIVAGSMIAGAARVIFCFDHTKFARRSTFFLCDFEKVDVVVTDEAAPADLVRDLRGKDIDVIVAPAVS